MVAHGEFWHIAHEIVQPVVNASQHVDWLAHVTAHTHSNTQRQQSCKICHSRYFSALTAFSALTLLVGHQKEHLACKNI